MLRKIMLPILLTATCSAASCHDDPSPVETDQPSRGNRAPPAFLMQGWIQPIANNVARTYDFTQRQEAGVYTVEIRSWQLIGTLGWQSNQLYSYATYTADERAITITTATGYRESWSIMQRTGSTMTLQDNVRGGQVTWYNCSAQGWPPLIYASMRGC